METVTLIIAALNLAATAWLATRLRQQQQTTVILPIEYVELTAEELVDEEEQQPVETAVPVETPPEQTKQTGAWVNRQGIPLSELNRKPQPPIQNPPDRPYGWSS